MGTPELAIIRLRDILGCRIRMVRCIEDEPEPPSEPDEFEAWCESGKSGRTIQTHLGDYGIVQRIIGEEAIVVRFDDCDERTLYVDEVSLLTN